jgi:hypothetical protein
MRAWSCAIFRANVESDTHWIFQMAIFKAERRDHVCFVLGVVSLLPIFWQLISAKFLMLVI